MFSVPVNLLARTADGFLAANRSLSEFGALTSYFYSSSGFYGANAFSLNFSTLLARIYLAVKAVSWPFGMIS